MRFYLALFVFGAVLATVLAETKFTTKYDNVNIEDVLKSDRLLQNYVDCILHDKKCTPDGAELKKGIPLALKDECAGCSEKQRVGAEKVIKFLIKNKPEIWKKLKERYDPEGTYEKLHKDEAKKLDITV